MDQLLEQEFKNKTVLITGGTGSIGSELVRQVLQYQPAKVRVFSRDETKQYELIESLNYPENLNILIGDIRDKERLNFAFRGVDIVLHAAAMKHVSISEYNPFEVIKTNIVGSQNVIETAIEQKVKKVVGISTDKAVSPTGILGTSKLMMEKLFVNANNYIKSSDTKFLCVRFGNVMWSRGSVLPSWKEHANNEKTIKVTDKDMTRFFMSKEEAISLVLRAAALTQGGEIFTFKMSSVKLMDLANMFLEKYFPGKDIKIETIGQRQGEKKHEELFDQSDLGKAVFTDNQLFIIAPRDRLSGLYKVSSEKHSYPGFKEVESMKNISSVDAIDNEKIKSMI